MHLTQVYSTTINEMNPTLTERFGGFKTPFYHYDLDLLQRTLQAAKSEADRYGYRLHYALKANCDHRVLETIRNAGFGADCVSGNEVKHALVSGFDREQVVFAGVGKTDDEIIMALKENIFCFNCESISELEVINELARNAGKEARVALRLNPNVDAYTHKYITTGLDENKFGINAHELERIIPMLDNLKNLHLTGLHFHIGSQITDLGPFKNLCTRINEFIHLFEQRGIHFEHINAGGGLGINYASPDKEAIPDFNAYFSVFHQWLELRPGQTLHFELGRALVANCGNLIGRVLYVKEGLNTDFLVLDAGMTELIRPALYQAYHKIENLSQPSIDSLHRYDVVGPVCESSDCFGKAVMLPRSSRGDLIAIRSAGAYGEVMASQYNLRQRESTVYSER